MTNPDMPDPEQVEQMEADTFPPASVREEEALRPILLPGGPWREQTTRIVALGHYYPHALVGAAKNRLQETHASYQTATFDPVAMRRNLAWTRLIYALNQERQWPLKRLFALLDPLLDTDIVLAAVPPHLSYQAFWPIRALAKQLAEHDRVDATSCLVRHMTIRRIAFGGPSSLALHRQSIRVENPHLVAGRRVLLLDDIAKSGHSLMACRQLLLEAGAVRVQAMALGRVIVSANPSE